MVYKYMVRRGMSRGKATHPAFRACCPSHNWHQRRCRCHRTVDNPAQCIPGLAASQAWIFLDGKGRCWTVNTSPAVAIHWRAVGSWLRPAVKWDWSDGIPSVFRGQGRQCASFYRWCTITAIHVCSVRLAVSCMSSDHSLSSMSFVLFCLSSAWQAMFQWSDSDARSQVKYWYFGAVPRWIVQPISVLRCSSNFI